MNELDHDMLDHDEELDDDDYYPHAGQHGVNTSSMADVYAGPTDFAFNSRSYDDEDEALQAALKASMQGLPDDFVMPELKPISQPSILKPKPNPPPQAPPVPEPEPERVVEEEDDEIEDYDDDEPAKSLSPGV